MDLSVNMPSARPVTLVAVASRIVLFFSFRVDDATSRVAYAVPASLDIKAKAAVDLDKECGATVRTCLTKNQKPRN